MFDGKTAPTLNSFKLIFHVLRAIECRLSMGSEVEIVCEPQTIMEHYFPLSSLAHAPLIVRRLTQ